MTVLIWSLWLEVLGDALYEFMNSLYLVSPDAHYLMNVGFDEEEWRNCPDFFLDR